MDERNLIDLTADWTENSGCFGSALAIFYGLAVGLDAKTIVEVGVNRGGSTRAWLLAARRTGGFVTSIDISHAVADNVPEELRDRWRLVVARSQDVARDPKAYGIPETIDLLFLDGEHTYEAASAELAGLGRLVRSGGLIVMDDVWPMFPGVVDAFQEYSDCREKFRLPYGVPQVSPGGRDRTAAVIRR